MRKTLIAMVAAIATLLPITGANAHMPPDRKIAVPAGETVPWDGAEATGLNVNYFALAGGDTVIPPGTCSRAVLTRCETILLELDNPLTKEEIAAGETSKSKSGSVTIDQYAPFEQSDFDLLAFASDASGIPYDELGQSGEAPGEPETVGFSVQTTIDEPSAYVLLHVVYFAVPNSSYKGSVRF